MAQPIYQNSATILNLLSKFAPITLCHLNQLRCGNLNHPFLSTFSVDQQPEFRFPNQKSFGRETAKLRNAEAGAEQQLQHQDVS